MLYSILFWAKCVNSVTQEEVAGIYCGENTTIEIQRVCPATYICPDWSIEVDFSEDCSVLCGEEEYVQMRSVICISTENIRYLDSYCDTETYPGNYRICDATPVCPPPYYCEGNENKIKDFERRLQKLNVNMFWILLSA